MDVASIRELRLRVQGLRGPFDASAPEVVRRFVAVQAQEFLPAQWGLAARVPAEQRPDAASVADALDRGEILRTHVLRPTWHFLHPADARWVMELSAERVHRQNGLYYRRVGVEGEVATRGLDLVAASLAGGHRTRAELTAALEAGGLPLTGLAFGYLLMLAELERIAISGANVGKQRTYAAFDERVPASKPRPRDEALAELAFTYLLMLAELERIAISGANAGKQRTYAAFDERVPASKPRPRDEALAELAARYLASRGPATDRDFAAWSGFTLGDTRKAFADAADLAGDGASGGRITTIEIDGATHWVDAATVPDPPGGNAETTHVDLLQAYDEYIMGYAPPRTYLLPPGRSDPVRAEFPLHALVIGGVMAGRWAPVVEARRATLRVVPWRTFSPTEERSLGASLAEIERFLGVPVTIEREDP